MIEIIKIEPPLYSLYSPNDNLLGELNEYEFNEVRIQIVKEQVEGYYIKDGEEKLFINKQGKLDKWPEGYNLIEIQISRLFKAQREVNGRI